MFRDRIEITKDSKIAFDCPNCGRTHSMYYDGDPLSAIYSCRNEITICGQPFVLSIAVLVEDILNVEFLGDPAKRFALVECLRIEGRSGPSFREG